MWEPKNGIFWSTPPTEDWSVIIAILMGALLAIISAMIVEHTSLTRPAEKVMPNKYFRIIAILTLTLAIAMLTIMWQGMPSLEKIKDIVNIIFLLATLAIATLTYRQAKKTLFAPIKTETFKLQLKIFEEIFSYFQTKDEIALEEDFDFRETLRLNTFSMIDAYSIASFGTIVTFTNDREERQKAFSGKMIIREENMEKCLFGISPGMPDLHNQPVHSPPLQQSNWANYEILIIQLTKKYDKQLSEIERFTASPVIPFEIKGLIVQFKQAVEESIWVIEKCINQCAQEMPSHYPSPESLERFQSDWVYNSFHKNRTKLEPIARSIMERINSYLKVESIMQK